MADPTSLPQAAWNWIAGLLATALYGIIGWNVRVHHKKVEGHGKEISDLKLQAATFACADDVTRDFIGRQEFKAMEVEVAKMASRRELIAYMREHREEQKRWEAQQQRQHEQNREDLREIKEASLLRDHHAQEFRGEMRDAIGKLAIKVAEVATVQKVQGAPGSS